MWKTDNTRSLWDGPIFNPSNLTNPFEDGMLLSNFYDSVRTSGTSFKDDFSDKIGPRLIGGSILDTNSNFQNNLNIALNYNQVSNISDNKVSEPSPGSLETEFSDVSEGISQMTTLGLGMGLSELNNVYSSSLINQQELNAKIGNSQFGHGFDAQNQMQQKSNLDNTFSSLRSAEIGIGSAFGPEGLALGTVAAGVTSLVQASGIFDSSPNLTASSSGFATNTIDNPL